MKNEAEYMWTGDHLYVSNWDYEIPKNFSGCLILPNGSKYWYQNGLYHRDNDLPAAICGNGSKYWYQNGNLIKTEASK